MAFRKLELIEPILKALADEGYTTPTPIQQQSIPLVLERRDLLGCAQTGTGKTAAFAIPILHILHQEKDQERGRKQIKALILTPTRELAIQIDESFEAYGKYTDLTHAVIYGGVSQFQQTNQLRNGVDILVATPGRLLDLMSQGFIGLQHLKIFVLDEADRMLDMGFIHDVKRVIIKLPAKRQTLFFSATMPAEIQALANVLLTNPAKVEVTPVSSTVDAIEQSLFFVDKSNKPGLLLHLLKANEIQTALVFTRTKHGADKVVKILQRENITAAAIHGNKSQNARQNALSNFKNGNLKVLVATDIAARGIDIDELTHVINFELPNVPETYVHRIGRTGRAGNTGIALSFCDHEERTELKDIQKLIGKNIPIVDSHPYPLSAAAFVPNIGGPKRPPFNKKPNNRFHSVEQGGRRGYGTQRTGNK
jgi:ATP-dependent RNA helicase RhlE